MKNQIKKIYIYIVIITFCVAISICISCVKKTQTRTLLIDTEHSIIVDSLFAYDSIVVNDDIFDRAITFTRYSNGRPFTANLHMLNDNEYYEIRQIDNALMYFSNIQEDTILTLLTLSNKDTCSVFLYDRVCFAVWEYQWGSMAYEMTKEDNIYKTFKRSLQDSTYTEIFYYNDKYQISKFINTWRNNKIVYIPHNE
jgi:hypothetical protein